MLISLIAWIYISIICLIWGQMMLSAVVKTKEFPSLRLNASLICLAGLAVISTLALGLSLFMPLDWKAHLILLIPALAYCRKATNRQAIKIQLGSLTEGLCLTARYLLAAGILMVLIISVHSIVHPDTLNYHAMSILLFERYKSIPGIANLKNEIGFQCGWFAALALFQPDFSISYNIIFLNGAVLCWFLLFVVQQISRSLLSGPVAPGDAPTPAYPGSQYGWAWLLLLAYTFFSWTQIRLTAASPSPDFIVSLYSWAAIYLFLQMAPLSTPQPLYSSMIVLYCLGAILTKLSAIPLLLLTALLLVRYYRLRPAKFMIIYSGLSMLILFLKNRIASGYLLYPLPMPDIFHPVWKMKAYTITSFQHYISAYARFPIDVSDLDKYWPAPFSGWLPRWWHLITLPDQLLLLGILIGAILSLIFLAMGKYNAGQIAGKYPVALLITLAGSLVWFIGAPSPRFGTGFLVPLLFLLYRNHPLFSLRFFSFGQSRPPRPRHQRHTLSALMATGTLLFVIAGYTVYRSIHFLTPGELVYPTGIMTSAYDPIGCEKMQVDPLKNRIYIREDTGPVNCIINRGGFSPLGTSVREGFKPAE